MPHTSPEDATLPSDAPKAPPGEQSAALHIAAVERLAAARQSQIDTLTAKIARLTAEAEAASSENAALRAALDVSQDDLALALKDRAEKAKELIAITQLTTELEQRLTALDKASAPTAAPLVPVEETEHTPSDELRAALSAAQQEIADLRSSTSWRLTGPLRRLMRLLRR